MPWGLPVAQRMESKALVAARQILNRGLGL